ncbi:MAG TPA: circadian clock protein KaiC [Solirubrobacteraceae bacterium]|jgi:circadian clock protein KaiC|nr:circadian clock protein KaiC [Solirubrobacteraceae bacterium]
MNGEVERLQLGIPGFDQIAEGGIPRGRASLVVGTSGAGKTVFALQALAAGVRLYKQPGVLVTFDETPEDLLRNAQGFGWGLEEAVAEGQVAIIDCAPSHDEEQIQMGDFDFSALLARIMGAVERVHAQRVVMDSVSSLFPQFNDPYAVRRELGRVIRGLRQERLTTLITAERTEEYGPVARFGVEEFVADNVIILRNPLAGEQRRRTIEILKFRGVAHETGEYSYTIEAGTGIRVLPRSAIESFKDASTERVTTGIEGIDEMLRGGVYRDTVMLISGATGTGKTLQVCEFVRAGAQSGERGLLLSFEESAAQLMRNAMSWGVDLRSAVDSGSVRISARYPDRMSLEDLLTQIRLEVEEFNPTRVAVDSLTAIERGASPKAFREFISGLINCFKNAEVAAIVTITTPLMSSSEAISEMHISTLSDAVILLRYAEVAGDLRRVLTVLKMRGSAHDRCIREYTIHDTGMALGGAIQNVEGVLSGSVVHRPST